MADDRYRHERPPQQHRPEDQSSQVPSRHHARSSLDEPRSSSEASRSGMAASAALPSIHHSRPSSYAGSPSSLSRGPYNDPRYASPNSVNGYPPPSANQPLGSQLPSMQHHHDPRSGAYPPSDPRADPRGPYYDDRRGHPADAGYGQDAYYYRGPPGAPPNGYPRQHPAAYGPEYVQAGNGPPMAQAAPRQRTSIACRYCRKRKIRCSGYQTAPGGKCQNCARMNQECIFQPVSSSTSAAFIPVSAVPGGVPPGTQLFGAYGQPLAPGQHYGHSGGPPPPGPPHGGPGYYQQPLHSPTDSFASYGDPRGDDPQGRRRRRTPEDQDEGYRLPPPRNAPMPEDEPRRRSPAEASSTSSPGGLGHQHAYQGSHARQSPRNPPGHPVGPGAVPGRLSPGAQHESSGTSTPAQAHGPGGGQPPRAKGQSSVMSLSNLVDKNDIDKGMIDRLNRPRDSKGSPPSGARTVDY